MRHMNKKKIILSCLITALLLFGGYFLMQYMQIQQPIQQWADDQEGMNIKELDVRQSEIDITVHFDNQPQFGQLLMNLEQLLDEKAPNRTHLIQIDSNQSHLHDWWLQHAAFFWELRDHHQYSEIDPLLMEWQENNIIRNGSMIMDEETMYIYIETDDEEEIYVALPVRQAKGGE